MNDMPLPDRLLRIQDVTACTSLSKTTVYKRIAEGTFPAPVSLGAQCVRWRASDISAWVASLAPAARSPAGQP